MTNPTTNTTKKLTGFAAMSPERRQEVARKGAQATIAAGKRHAYTSETARIASRIGWARRKGTPTNSTP